MVDEFSQLEHRHLFPTAEHGQKFFVRVDVCFLLWILEAMLRIYSQIFLVSSVRGSGAEPTTADSAASGWTDLPKALLRFILAAVVFDDGMDK